MISAVQSTAGNIWLKRTHSRFVICLFKEIVRGLSNIVWLSLPIIADCFCTLNLWEPKLSREELNLLFDSISTLCSFQCARAGFRFALVPFATELVKFTSSALTCQLFFQVFSTSHWTSEALSFPTAFTVYQTFSSLSTTFLFIFVKFFAFVW